MAGILGWRCVAAVGLRCYCVAMLWVVFAMVGVVNVGSFFSKGSSAGDDRRRGGANAGTGNTNHCKILHLSTRLHVMK